MRIEREEEKIQIPRYGRRMRKQTEGRFLRSAQFLIFNLIPLKNWTFVKICSKSNGKSYTLLKCSLTAVWDSDSTVKCKDSWHFSHTILSKEGDKHVYLLMRRSGLKGVITSNTQRPLYSTVHSGECGSGKISEPPHVESGFFAVLRSLLDT